VTASLDQEMALSNAPDARGDFFRVPKVIEG
jgi:Asp-tRNA(Asn)/Glu-tRNA(Gln) amidotransferase C subunit